MAMRIIGVIGFLLRLMGLFFGVGWLILGIVEVSGISHDEKVNGPGFIGMGVVALIVTFAFSLRKRRAKKRAAASMTDSFRQTVREDIGSISDKVENSWLTDVDDSDEESPEPSTKSAVGKRLRMLGYFYGVGFVLYGLVGTPEIDDQSAKDIPWVSSVTRGLMCIVGVIILFVMRRLSSRANATS